MPPPATKRRASTGRSWFHAALCGSSEHTGALDVKSLTRTASGSALVTPRGSRYMPPAGRQHLKRSGSLARHLSGVGRDLVIDALTPKAAAAPAAPRSRRAADERENDGVFGAADHGAEHAADAPPLAITLPRAMWAEPDGASFDVRGPAYLTDRRKAPSAASLFALAHVDLFGADALAAPRPSVVRGVAAAHARVAQLRRAQRGCVGDSFPTISSAGANAAVIHYQPAPGACAELGLDKVYLCDTGGQYADGTTDVTRTLHFGAPTADERRCYTRVLQGHVALAGATFPEGTPGLALDALARAPLWRDRLNYGHGTGHGIGAYLNVHEGPFGVGGGTVSGERVTANTRMRRMYLAGLTEAREARRASRALAPSPPPHTPLSPFFSPPLTESAARAVARATRARPLALALALARSRRACTSRTSPATTATARSACGSSRTSSSSRPRATPPPTRATRARRRRPRGASGCASSA